MRRFAPAFGSLLLLAVAMEPGCLVSRKLNLGVPDREARGELSQGTIVYCKQDGVYLARGDGGGSSRLISTHELGHGAAVFMPALSPAADAGSAAQIFFFSVEDLEVRESTGRDLALNVLELAGPAAPGAAIRSWRRVRLEKLAPPGPDGRQEIFAVAGAAWSRDGRRIAVGLNRPAADGGDVVVLFGADASPLSIHDLGGSDLARVSSLSWTREDNALVLGLEGADETLGVVSRLDLSPSGAGGRGGRLAELAPGRYPMLSPDGESIAMVEETNGLESIVLRDPSGKERERFERPAGRALNRPFWSSDGRYLYYYSLGSTGPLGLIDVSILRCLDTRTRRVYDVLRLG